MLTTHTAAECTIAELIPSAASGIFFHSLVDPAVRADSFSNLTLVENKSPLLRYQVGPKKYQSFRRKDCI